MTERKRKPRAPKTPKRIARILDAANRGERLVRSFLRSPAGDVRVSWLLEPSGRRVPAKTAAEATAYLAPASDGLFGPESSQTWRSPA